ncbi:hypothetical protein [Streptomyces sp. NPDC005017]|uniref:hypothetical protein n=1 Tax=Streptomyces sp. NPDC005017 TaxID=3364706 RepID=UPI0036C265BF
MVQNLVAVFSLLVGLAGLALSYAGHRQKVRQERESTRRADEQGRAERAREREAAERLERERQDREREADARRERARRARRERERYQASMIVGQVRLSRSTLSDNWVVPQVVVLNGSDQPVLDVRVSLRGEVISEMPVLAGGSEIFPLPPVRTTDDHHGQLGEVTVEFTDVQGIRWRREGQGALERAGQGVGGQENWGAPEPPVVRPDGPPSGPSAPEGERTYAPAPPPSAGGARTPYGGGARTPYGQEATRRRAAFLRPLMVLVSLALIAVGIWWLLR